MQRGWLRNSFPKGNKHTRKHSSTMSLHPLSQVPLALGTKKNPLLFSFMFFSFFFFFFTHTHTRTHLGFYNKVYVCVSPIFFFQFGSLPSALFLFPVARFISSFKISIGPSGFLVVIDLPYRSSARKPTVLPAEMYRCNITEDLSLLVAHLLKNLFKGKKTLSSR